MLGKVGDAMSEKKNTNIPKVAKKKKTPPDVGFRVLTVENEVPVDNEDAILWDALITYGEELIMSTPIHVSTQKIRYSRTSSPDDFAKVYYVGEKRPYIYVACMSPHIDVECSMRLYCESTRAIILRECAVTAEVADMLRFLHAGVGRDVTVYMHCPPKCPTCQERQR